MNARPLLIAVMGPTASGKTTLAEQIADQTGAALISADALQAYRGMDIGTAKPQNKERYDLLDLKQPNESYGLGEFCRLAGELLNGYWERRRNVVVVGGTGLYIRGLFEEYATLDGSPSAEVRNELNGQLRTLGLPSLVQRLLALDETAASRIDLGNPVRVTRALERLLDPRPNIPIKLPEFAKLKLGLTVETEELSRRIEERTQIMVQNGWVDEVRSLVERGYGRSDPGFRAIGYSEIADSLVNETGLEEAIATTIVETRQYAKRQRTWLRSEPNLVNIASGAASFDEARSQIMRIAMGSING